MPAAPKLILVYTKDQDLNRIQHNTAEAFRHLQNALSGNPLIMDCEFLAVDPAASTPGGYAFQVATTATPIGVEVLKAVNLTTPSRIFYDAVAAPTFTVAGNVVRVPFFTGLFFGDRYRLTLRITLGD